MYRKLLLTKDRIAMSASNDGKVVVTDRSDNRAIWVRPTLRRLAANKAERRAQYARVTERG